MTALSESIQIKATEIIERELETARTMVKPISRRSLVSILIRELNIEGKDAEEFVEMYCDEKAPYTPEYLDREFFMPYAKMTGLTFAVISIVLLAIGANKWKDQTLSWPYFMAGAVLFTLSGVGLMKVLRREKESD